MNQTAIDHFRCPLQFFENSQFDINVSIELVQEDNQSRVDFPTFSAMKNGAVERWGDTKTEREFDLESAVEDLRQEHYVDACPETRNLFDIPLLRYAYYTVRPLLPTPLRRRIQSNYFAGFQSIPFPRWPVDCTVDDLLERDLVASIKRSGVSRVPFIWFWPDGYSGCLIVTHDVETRAGLDYCPQMMDMDEASGIRSSFQIIPRGRYPVPPKLLQQMRDRGFELNIHDFNHDGLLYANRETFRERTREINLAAREFGAAGFRSGGLYRKQEWYSDFELSYDMSVPNCGHLEAQRGGCCTVMPYFIGNIVELPLTTAQDYPLFCLLGDFDLSLWKSQVELILKKHGLISFLTHPDYVREPRPQAAYRSLLAYLTDLSSDRDLWVTKPGDVDRWWRNRSQMKLLPEGDGWRIEGPDSEHAQLSYAAVDGDRLTYKICTKCLVS
jgi:hypothetical protein